MTGINTKLHHYRPTCNQNPYKAHIKKMPQSRNPTESTRRTSKCQRPGISAKEWIDNNLAKSTERPTCRVNEVKQLKSLSDAKIEAVVECHGDDTKTTNKVADTTNTSGNSSNGIANWEVTPEVASDISRNVLSTDADVSQLAQSWVEAEFDKCADTMNHEETNREKSGKKNETNMIQFEDPFVDGNENMERSWASEILSGMDAKWSLEQYGQATSDMGINRSAMQTKTDSTPLKTVSNEHSHVLKDAKMLSHRRSSSLQLTTCISSDLFTIPEELVEKRHSTENYFGPLEQFCLPRAQSEIACLYNGWNEGNKDSLANTLSTIKRGSIVPPIPKTLPKNNPVKFNSRMERHCDMKQESVKPNMSKIVSRNSKASAPGKLKKGPSNFKKLKEAGEHFRKSVHTRRRHKDSDTNVQQQSFGDSVESAKYCKTKHDKDAHSKRRVFHSKKTRDAKLCRNTLTGQTSSESENTKEETMTSKKLEKSRKSANVHRTLKYTKGVELFKILRDKKSGIHGNNNDVNDTRNDERGILQTKVGSCDTLSSDSQDEPVKVRSVFTEGNMPKNVIDRPVVMTEKHNWIDSGKITRDETMSSVLNVNATSGLKLEHVTVASKLKDDLIQSVRCEFAPLGRTHKMKNTNDTLHMDNNHGNTHGVKQMDGVNSCIVDYEHTHSNRNKTRESTVLGKIVDDTCDSDRTDDYKTDDYKTDDYISSTESSMWSVKQSTDDTDIDRESLDVQSTEDTDNDMKSLDSLTGPLDWRRRAYSRSRQDSEDREWKQREKSMTEKIQWLRKEIGELKKQDQSLMRQFLQLRSTIHAIKRNQDNASFTTPNASESCNYLQLASKDNLNGGLIDISLFGSSTNISYCNAALNDANDQNGNLCSLDGRRGYLPEFRARTVSLVQESTSEMTFVKQRTMTFSSGSKHNDRGVSGPSDMGVMC